MMCTKILLQYIYFSDKSMIMWLDNSCHKNRIKVKIVVHTA